VAVQIGHLLCPLLQFFAICKTKSKLSRPLKTSPWAACS